MPILVTLATSMMLNHFFKTQRTSLIVLLLLFFGCELFIFPIDAFPLNDDWSYTYSVKHFSETGDIDLGYWPAMNLVAHVMWGNIFVKLFGFSHFVLRCSTLMLSVLTLIALYKLLYGLCRNHYKAFLFTLFLVFNPVFFLLSNTFMTDVPFLCSVVISFYMAEKILVQKKYGYVIYFSLFSIYSILIRQFGLALAVSFFGASVFLVFTEKNKWKVVLVCLTPIVTSVITVLLFEKWVVHHLPPGSAYQSSSVASGSLSDTVSQIVEVLPMRFSEIMLYLGLFICPLGIIISVKLIKQLSLKDYLFVVPLFVIICFASICNMSVFPIGNVIYNCGLGVETLYDIQILNTNTSHAASGSFPVIISTLAVVGMFGLSFVLSVAAIRFFRKIICREPVNLLKVFLVFFAIVYFMVLCVSKSFFDRYSLPLFAPCLLLVIGYYAPSRMANYAVIIYFVVTAGFTVLATKDYFNWNRARYKTIDKAVQQGIKPSDINGGFEYVAGTFYNDPWWGLWTGEPPYAVTFGPVKNYRKINYTTYSRYLPLRTDTLFLYQKKE